MARSQSPLVLLTAAVPGVVGAAVNLTDDIHEIALFSESSGDYAPAGVNPEFSIVTEVARCWAAPMKCHGRAPRDETPDWIKAMEPKRESIVEKLFPSSSPERPEAPALERYRHTPGADFTPGGLLNIPFSFIRARSQGSPLQAGTLTAGVYLGAR